MNKNLESVDTVHTHTHTQYNSRENNKKGKNNCLCKRYIYNRPIIDIMVCFLYTK